MTMHTSEPWRMGGRKIDMVNGGSYIPVYGPKGEWIADVRAPKENAQRIVAAVNACRRIPTKAIEEGAVSELLAACEELCAQAFVSATEFLIPKAYVKAVRVARRATRRIREAGSGCPHKLGDVYAQRHLATVFECTLCGAWVDAHLWEKGKA